jgi:hypothetical protein
VPGGHIVLLLERFEDILQWRVTTEDKLLSSMYSCQYRAGHVGSIKRNRIQEVDIVIARASVEDRNAHMSSGSITGIKSEDCARDVILIASICGKSRLDPLEKNLFGTFFAVDQKLQLHLL